MNQNWGLERPPAKTGRTAIPMEYRKCKAVNVRFTPSAYEKLLAVADKYHMSVVALIRSITLSELRHQTEHAEKQEY